MFSKEGITSLALAALLFCGSSSAAPQFESSVHSTLDRRQVSDASANSTGTSLEPVVPPDVNENALATLALNTNITLAWAGSTTGSSPGHTRLLRRDGGIFSQAAFKFKYPTVPLDHSNFISSVSCSGGSLTGILSDNAYAFAKNQWTGTPDILFVTSVDGCGMDNANEFFHASSITFSDTTKSFTAKGSSTGYKNAAAHMNLKWGDIGTLKLKRSVDKRDMFEPPPLHRRASASITLSWEAYLDHLIGVDNDAPWDNAALLFKWGKEGGEEDDSYEKGEVASPDGHHKRSNETSLESIEDLEGRAAPKDLSYGLKLYCVECGFAGSATIWGEIDVDILFFSVNTVQAGFNANFQAGLNIGMQAYVKYEKEWEKELDRIPLDGFDIPLLVDIRPFVSVSIKATAGIEASGSLLVGAGVSWDNIDILLDVLDSSNSHINGLSPRFVHRAEAAGEVKVSASLGLPIKLGLGVDILDGLWEANASIVDTPSIVAEGKFEVSATVTDDGTIEPDINGGCYGIAWDIHFENTPAAVIKADDIGELTYNLIKPQESEPIAEGCIGYVNDGVDIQNDDPQGDGFSDGFAGNGMNSGGNGLSGGKGSGSGSGKPSTTTTPSPSTTAASTSTTSSSPSTTTTGTTKGTTTGAAKGTTTTTTITSPSKTTTTTKPPVCTPTKAIVNTKPPSGSTYKKITTQANVSATQNVGKASTVSSVDLCAALCLKAANCVSFGYNDKNSCQLYSKAVKSLGVTTQKGKPTINFYDKACYVWAACK